MLTWNHAGKTSLHQPRLWNCTSCSRGSTASLSHVATMTERLAPMRTNCIQSMRAPIPYKDKVITYETMQGTFFCCQRGVTTPSSKVRCEGYSQVSFGNIMSAGPCQLLHLLRGHRKQQPQADLEHERVIEVAGEEVEVEAVAGARPGAADRSRDLGRATVRIAIRLHDGRHHKISKRHRARLRRSRGGPTRSRTLQHR